MTMIRFRFGMMLLVATQFLLSCSLSPLPPVVEFKVRANLESGQPKSAGSRPQQEQPPEDNNSNSVISNPGDFRCYIVSISGSGIPDSLSSSSTGGMSPSCLGLDGATTLTKSKVQLSGGVSLRVTAGTGRTVRILGVTSPSGCTDDANVSQLFANGNTPAIYPIGERTVSITGDGDLPTIGLSTPSGPYTNDRVGACGRAISLNLVGLYRGVTVSNSSVFVFGTGNPSISDPSGGVNTLSAIGTLGAPKLPAVATSDSATTPVLMAVFAVPNGVDTTPYTQLNLLADVANGTSSGGTTTCGTDGTVTDLQRAFSVRLLKLTSQVRLDDSQGVTRYVDRTINTSSLLSSVLVTGTGSNVAFTTSAGVTIPFPYLEVLFFNTHPVSTGTCGGMQLDRISAVMTKP